VGAQALRCQRVVRKRFLARLQQGEIGRLRDSVAAHPAGQAFADALRAWVARRALGPPSQPDFAGVGEGVSAGDGCRVSVIINTVDRARELVVTLEDLAGLWDGEQDELIVVLGPTDDESAEILEKSPLRHRLVHCPERNLAVSRNLGLQAASGRFVVFLDDDASPEPGWLESLIAPFEMDPQVAVAAGFVLDGDGRKAINQHVVADTLGRAWSFGTADEARLEIQKIGPQRAFLTATGCNMAFRRDLLVQVGGFDPYYRYFLEETDAVARLAGAGFRCEVVPSSRVRHRLGSNPGRQRGVEIDARRVIMRSQLHFIGKFGKSTCSAAEIECCIWRRVLGDLERIAWESHLSPNPALDCAEWQERYLAAVSGDLRLDSPVS
jgi:GT2 family glycosyltransferase